jgi:hypothetical protein
MCYTVVLKRHSHEKVFEIIPLHHRLGPSHRYDFFKEGGGLRCKMGRADLPKPEATHTLAIFEYSTCHSSVPYSSSVYALRKTGNRDAPARCRHFTASC